MRVRDWVLDVIDISMTLALCDLCTGTRFNWRRDFKWLSQNSQNRLHSGKNPQKVFNKSW